MATANKFQSFVEYLAEGKMNLEGDTLKVALTNSAPVNTNSVLANITQISAGAGYTTGGNQATVSSSGQTSGTYKLVVADVVFTASGSMGPFRYAVFYDDTPAATPTDPLIMWHDYGSAITLLTGETFTWDADPTTGIGTIV